jgi:hypothetical protein
MPKTIYIPEDADRSGIDISYVKSTQRLFIGGWYNSCVGMTSGTFTLHEFLTKLGITEKEILKCYKNGQL